MPSDPSSFETELGKHQPAALDDTLLERLEGCIDGTWDELSAEEKVFESRLRETTPAALPPALLASLESAIGDTPFPTTEKVVSFPTTGESSDRGSNRSWLGAAAAVALLGGLAALSLPVGGNNKTTTLTKEVRTASPQNTGRSLASPALSPSAAMNLVPSGFRRGLTEASDHGVVINNRIPHRVLKVVYQDIATFKGPDGKTYQANQPREEYILVPTKAD